MSDIPKKKATIMGKSRLPLCLALTAAFAAVYFYVATRTGVSCQLIWE